MNHTRHSIYQRFCKYKKEDNCMYSSLLLGKTKKCEALNCYFGQQVREHNTLTKLKNKTKEKLFNLHKIDLRIDKLLGKR